MPKRCRRDVFVLIAEAGVRMLDHSHELEWRHERRAFADACRPLRGLIELVDPLARKPLFTFIVSAVADLLQDEASGIALRVPANGSVPAGVVPRHTDR